MSSAARTLRDRLAGSQVTRQERQAPVSFRVIPQVHGSAQAALDRLAAAALIDMNANGDNPLFVADRESPTGGTLVNAGNFHNAELTAAVEALTVALVHVGTLAEKRCSRLLDQRASGLSPQLARDPGLDAGLVTVHKAAVGYGAELRALAAPVSILHADTSFGQEDVQTLALPALHRLMTAVDDAAAVLAHELYVAAVAIDQRGEHVAAAVGELHRSVRRVAAAYEGDRAYGADLDALIAMLGASLDVTVGPRP
jgi:histidine ammonia-lyase